MSSLGHPVYLERYGRSGTVECRTALCLLSLNVVNEVFLALWFWLLVLAIVMGIFVIFRLLVLASSRPRA